MRRVVISVLLLSIVSAFVVADTAMNGLFDAADAVSDDLVRMLDEPGDLLLGSVEFGPGAVRMGDLLADLVANRLAGRPGYRPRIINRAVSPSYRPSDADWVLSGSLFRSGAAYLITLQLIDTTTAAQIKGWEFAISSTGSEDLMTPSAVTGLEFEWDRYEPNDTYAAAATVELPFYEEELSFHAANDSDWFALEITPSQEKVLFLTARTFGELDTYMELYSPGDTAYPVAENDDDQDSNAVIRFPLTEAGVWHLRVKGYDESITGPYGLEIDVAEGHLGPGEPNESPSAAIPIAPNGNKARQRVDYPGDEDWFVIDLSRSLGAEEALIVETFGDLDLLLTVLDENENYLIEDDDSGNDSNPMAMLPGLAAGRYYAIVSPYEIGYEGPYEISASVVRVIRDAFEPDDRMEDASDITVDGPVQERTFVPGTDEDWARFTVRSPGIYVIETQGPLDTYIVLYNGNGEVITENDDFDDANAKILVELDQGRYYVQVTSYNGSVRESYRLSVTSR